MREKIFPKKTQVYSILGIILLSLIVIWPSFLLHFDGDSYLTLWRYQLSAKQNSNLAFPFMSTFFTDYGPQDTIFAILYNMFGFQPVYFYTISFLFRLAAGFSFYPLLFYITKNEHASYFSVIFFALNPVGLETTNWVFNMPSYLGIVFLNVFLLLYLKLLDKLDLGHFVLSLLVFFLLIIIQPIRMVFIFPLLIISGLITLLFKKTRKKNSIVLHLGYILFFLIIFTFGNIGDSVGVKDTPKEKITGAWINNTFVGTGGLNSAIKEKNYKFIYSYVGQLGNIVFPDTLLSKETQYPTPRQMLFKKIFPIFFIYCLIVLLIKDFKKYRVFQITIALIWTLHIWWIFHYKALYPSQFYEIAAYLKGGYFLLIITPLLLLSKNKPKIFDGLVIGLLILLLSFFIPWTRSPFQLIETTGRYLIVGAAGFSILVGLLFYLLDRNKLLKIGFLIYLIIFGASSFNYLRELYKYRGYSVTEKIRSSIPIIAQFKQTKEPVMVYLESDNDKQLYHSLYFGFPVMMYFYQGASDIWNIAYTTEWKEVASAYQTGEGFRRFGTMPTKPANIENIFSFKLTNSKIVDTTQQTRAELIKIPRL